MFFAILSYNSEHINKKGPKRLFYFGLLFEDPNGSMSTQVQHHWAHPRVYENGAGPTLRLVVHVGAKAILVQGVRVDTVIEILLDFCFLSFLAAIFYHMGS